MDSEPDLSVSVVTYNSQDCLATLFSSLDAQKGVHWELFLADNASSDQTAGILSNHAAGRVARNPENVGYGRAHNQSARRFRGRHLLFLNPDVELPPGLFAGLVRFLDENPTVAIAGPKILEGPSRVPFPPRLFYPGEVLMPLGTLPAPGHKAPGESAPTQLAPSQYAWINGCCLAIRRSVFEDLGGFDPAFFLYFEEVDLCLRARQAGWRLGWLPQFEVIHRGLGSQGNISDYDQARRLFTGALLFWEKRYPVRDQVAMLRVQVLAAGMLVAASRIFRALGDSHRGLRPDRLRARRDICREWLESHGYRLWAPDSRSLRIAARLAGLAAKWVLRRHIHIEDV